MKKYDEKEKTEIIKKTENNNISKKELEKIKEILYEEIRMKDKIIDELRKQNEILLRTALKNANRKIEEEEIKEVIRKK